MRINRFLAAAGLGSRRSCEELILTGTVTINGQVCTNLATDVADSDFVKVGNHRVLPEEHHYLLLHKPRGYLCTASDTHDRRTIFELLPRHMPRLFHVGRLDRDSEGLIILTNDGDLSLHLTHPRFKIEKEYEVLLDRSYDAAKDSPRLLRGVNIEGGHARADAVRQLAPNIIRIVLRQGLKRQIRHMLYKVGYDVKRLIRIRIGSLRLSELHPGQWRVLTRQEVTALLKKRPASPPEETRSRPKSRPRRDGDTSRRPDTASPRGHRRTPLSRSGPSGRGRAASAPRAARQPK